MSAPDDDGFLSRWSRRKAQVRRGLPLAQPVVPTVPATEVPAAEVPAIEEVPAAKVPATAVPATARPTEPTSAAEALPAQPVGTAATRPAARAKPPPTLADVAALTRESDFSRFVAPEVDGEVRNAALKRLFADPHYNVMDGLDIYIDDYTKPDPLPRSMLRKMAQAAALGLLEAEPPAADPAKPPVPTAEAAKPPVPTAEAPQPDEPVAPAAAAEPDEDAALRLQPHHAAGCGGAEDGAAGSRRQA